MATGGPQKRNGHQVDGVLMSPGTQCPDIESIATAPSLQQVQQQQPCNAFKAVTGVGVVTGRCS